jgi:hypothetical protein
MTSDKCATGRQAQAAHDLAGVHNLTVLLVERT